MKARRNIADLSIGIVALTVVVALTLPPSLQGKWATNESSAIATLRSLHQAQMSYAQALPTRGFADDLVKLHPRLEAAASPGDEKLNFLRNCAAQPCEISGYLFAIDQTSGTPVDTFRITAVPAMPGKTGIRGFCASSAGVISYDPEGGKTCSYAI